jgi:hypothetical protein
VTFDFVAEPAAGAFPAVFFEWKGQKLDTKNVTPEMLKEAAPELVKAISEAAVRLQGRRTRRLSGRPSSLEPRKPPSSRSVRNSARELLTQVAKAKKDLREEVSARNWLPIRRLPEPSWRSESSRMPCFRSC